MPSAIVVKALLYMDFASALVIGRRNLPPSIKDGIILERLSTLHPEMGTLQLSTKTNVFGAL
jgi:hypothetical protein